MDNKLWIAKPIEAELEVFNTLYKESVKSDNPRIQEYIDYSFVSSGKKIRPILLLYAAKACGQVNDISYLSAITVELLHMASLIHDDVVDESLLRRGNPSMNAVFDNKISVLVGDYFLSTALIKSVLTGNLQIISDISALGRNLAEGELNQLSLAKKIIIDEDQYFEVIKKKTASLLSICMKTGATSVGASQEQILFFEKLGEYLGICFQIRDDIFDYFSNNVGKPTGNDIREGKVTLPLLYAIKNCADKQVLENVMSIINAADFTDENVNFLLDFAKNNEGIVYAYSQIDIYKAKALNMIEQLPDSDIKKGLTAFVYYIVAREY